MFVLVVGKKGLEGAIVTIVAIVIIAIVIIAIVIIAIVIIVAIVIIATTNNSYRAQVLVVPLNPKL